MKLPNSARIAAFDFRLSLVGWFLNVLFSYYAVSRAGHKTDV